jgi:hypothetical protein
MECLFFFDELRRSILSIETRRHDEKQRVPINFGLICFFFCFLWRRPCFFSESNPERRACVRAGSFVPRAFPRVSTVAPAHDG